MAEPQFYIDLELYDAIRFTFATRAERDNKYAQIRQFFINNGITSTQGQLKKVERHEWQIIDNPEYKRDFEVVTEIN